MKKNVKIRCDIKTLKRGSAIIMALLTMTILVVLGLAVASLSFSSLMINTSDATNNNAYYAAEAGAKSAIEQLKYEASSYYNSMLQAQGSDFGALYSNFFANINNNASQHFTEPSITGITTTTTFTQGAFDSVNNTCQFLVSCTSTAAYGMRYKVNGSLSVKRVDVSSGSGWSYPSNAVTAGGALNLGSTGMSINGGNAVVANLIGQTSKINFTGGGHLYIDPNIGLSIKDGLKYPSYTVPSGVTETQGNVSLSGATHNGDIYCTGNFTCSRITINGNIYCRGNVTVTGGNVNGNITCDGTVSISNNTLVGTVLAKNVITTDGGTIHGSLFSPASISTLGGTTFTNGIIYSSTKITVGGSSSSGILFSGGGAGGTSGDINITGAPTFNLVVAKRNITLSNKWVTVNYSAAKVQAILSDPLNSFFVKSSDPELNEEVILEQNVSAIGRIN